MTQAARIVSAIRKRPMTYVELNCLGISASWWKRLAESGHKYLKPGEQIVRKPGRDGLVRIGVVRVS